MRIGLILGEVFQGLKRNLSVVVSVVLVTFVSLTFVGSAILIQLQVQEMKSFWYDRAQVAISLCTENDETQTCSLEATNDEQKSEIEDALKSETLAPYVQEYYFVDREQAYDEFMEQFAENPISEITTIEQLPETFWVKLKEGISSEIIIETFSGVPGVHSVSDQRALLDKIFTLLRVASYSAVAIAALMLVAAMLLISTTIRLSAFSRRREISIMRLVGASNMFIQTPFVIEGIIAAVFGAILAGGATLAIVRFFVTDFLTDTVPFTSFITLQDAYIVPPILLAVGVILSAIAAKVAITRYLRV